MTEGVPQSADPRHVAETYDQVSRLYDSWIWQKFWRQNELPIVRDAIWVSPPIHRTLDVGIGTGTYVPVHRVWAQASVGIDLSLGMLQVLRRRYPTFPVAVASAEAFPFKEETFDGLLATRLLSHVENLELFFAETGRTLTRQARLVVSDVDAEHMYETIRFSDLAGITPRYHLLPFKRTVDEIVACASTFDFVPDRIVRVRRRDLLWEPDRDGPSSLGHVGARHVFFVASFRRRALAGTRRRRD